VTLYRKGIPYMRFALLRAKPATQGRRPFFLYPALTSQRVRKRPRWLDVLMAYSRPPLRGWCWVRLTVSDLALA